MAVPKFEDFLYPFILQLKEGDITLKEMKKRLARHFRLTDEDLALTTKSGTSYQFDDRVQWCRQWFRRALFIEIPQTGTYRITQRGKDYLANHDSLRESDLLGYKEFAEYSGRKAGKKNTNEKSTIPPIQEELTPIDMMDNAYKQINDYLAAELLQKVLDLDARFFEKLVLDLLLKMGYGGAHKDKAYVTSYSKDRGVDAVIPEDALGFEKIYIQAKHYSKNNVSTDEFQAFVGAIDTMKASKGVLITTKDFVKKIRTEMLPKISKKVILINGEELAKYMIEYGVGVSKSASYTINKIDTDYFEE